MITVRYRLIRMMTQSLNMKLDNETTKYLRTLFGMELLSMIKDDLK